MAVRCGSCGARLMRAEDFGWNDMLPRIIELCRKGVTVVLVFEGCDEACPDVVRQWAEVNQDGGGGMVHAGKEETIVDAFSRACEYVEGKGQIP
jgi:hypothetical protein